MRQYRVAKRADRMDAFAAQIRRQRTTAGIHGATAQLARAFGGPLGFAAAFKICFDTCPPGSTRAVTMLAAMLRLIETSQPSPLDQLSDAELNAAIERGQSAP